MQSPKDLFQEQIIVGTGVNIDPNHIIDKTFREYLAQMNTEAKKDVYIPDGKCNGHFWCFGATKVGKTRLIENMCVQDIKNGDSIIIVDPSSDIDLLAKIIQTAAEERRLEDMMLVSPVFPDVSASIAPESGNYSYDGIISTFNSCFRSAVNGSPDNFIKTICFDRPSCFSDRLNKGKRVIAVIQLGKLINYAASRYLGNLVISAIYGYAGNLQSSNKQLAQPLSLYLDDSFMYFDDNVVNMLLLNKANGIRVHGFAHSINQLDSIGNLDRIKSVMGTINALMCMRACDSATAEFMSSTIGQVAKYLPKLSLLTINKPSEADEIILLPEDIMWLKPREYYLLTGGMKYFGCTLDIARKWLKLDVSDCM